jgi:hypothetical protein
MNILLEKIYFRFEEDFVEDNVRCIPMIVRFKLDSCGIKLKLAEWSKMTPKERESLAEMPCHTEEEINHYRNCLEELIFNRTGNEATTLPVVENPPWTNTEEMPYPLEEKLKEFNWNISIQQWQWLSELQRFTLLKLSYPGHENKNFPIAMREFRLL